MVMLRNLGNDPKYEHAFGDLPEHIRLSAMVLSLLTNALGFGGDKLIPLLDRAREFADDAGYAQADTSEAVEELYVNIRAAMGDDLDGYSVAVGVAFALNLYAGFAMDDVMKKGAKHN